MSIDKINKKFPIIINIYLLCTLIFYYKQKKMNCISNIIYLNTTLSFISAIILVIIGCLYIYLTSTFNYWEKLGVPYKTPTIIIGNFGDLLLFRKSQCEGIYDMYNWFNDSRYFGVFRLRSPIFIVRDLNLVKNICIKDFNYFINRAIPTSADELLTRHLFNLEGDEWKNLRLKLSPIFSSGKIKRMFYLLIDCHKSLEKLINNNIINNNSTIDVRDLAGKFVIDVIGTCAFGIHINTLLHNNSQFHMMMKKLSRPSYKSTLWRMLRNSLPKIYYLLGIQLIDPQVTHFFHDIVTQMVKQRECDEYKNKRNDFMDLLIELKNNEITINNNGNTSEMKSERVNKKYIDFNDDMIVAQAFAFFIAGHETSSNTIAFCLYELALNPEIQLKVRDDIWMAINNNNGNFSYKSIEEMSYLDAVVLETLRKYPPAPMTSRRCEYPYKIDGTEIILPAGMRVVIPIYGIHHDPKYYPNPNQFDPNRFIDYEMNKIRHPYSFLPFGEGPRNCIGMKFAKVLTKIGIISFIKQYDVGISEKTVVPIKFSRRSIVTSSENGFWLKIKSNIKN